eukprot:UC1_evm1s1580
MPSESPVGTQHDLTSASNAWILPWNKDVHPKAGAADVASKVAFRQQQAESQAAAAKLLASQKEAFSVLTAGAQAYVKPVPGLMGK